MRGRERRFPASNSDRIDAVPTVSAGCNNLESILRPEHALQTLQDHGMTIYDHHVGAVHGKSFSFSPVVKRHTPPPGQRFRWCEGSGFCQLVRTERSQSVKLDGGQRYSCSETETALP